jgi:hypothetical protein
MVRKLSTFTNVSPGAWISTGATMSLCLAPIAIVLPEMEEVFDSKFSHAPFIWAVSERLLAGLASSDD